MELEELYRDSVYYGMRGEFNNGHYVEPVYTYDHLRFRWGVVLGDTYFHALSKKTDEIVSKKKNWKLLLPHFHDAEVKSFPGRRLKASFKRILVEVDYYFRDLELAHYDSGEAPGSQEAQNQYEHTDSHKFYDAVVRTDLAGDITDRLVRAQVILAVDMGSTTQDSGERVEVRVTPIDRGDQTQTINLLYQVNNRRVQDLDPNVRYAAQLTNQRLDDHIIRRADDQTYFLVAPSSTFYNVLYANPPIALAEFREYAEDAQRLAVHVQEFVGKLAEDAEQNHEDFDDSLIPPVFGQNVNHENYEDPYMHPLREQPLKKLFGAEETVTGYYFDKQQNRFAQLAFPIDIPAELPKDEFKFFINALAVSDVEAVMSLNEQITGWNLVLGNRNLSYLQKYENVEEAALAQHEQNQCVDYRKMPNFTKITEFHERAIILEQLREAALLAWQHRPRFVLVFQNEQGV